jgi:predicted nucleic acid-binding protein
MFIFLDSSALIYLIEGAEPFSARVRKELSVLSTRRPVPQVALSRLTWLECRVRPVRDGEVTVLAAFDEFLARPDIVWIELSRQVIELATEIRAKTGLKTPDALQAACCLQLGPDHLLLTGDADFRRVADLRVKVLA